MAKKIIKKVQKRIVKNNSAFKRAMVQMDIKHGEKIGVVFDDGTVYTVECP